MVLIMGKDFGEIVYSTNQPYTGVLILRFEDFDSAQKLDPEKVMIE